jgi:hypothetical protein
MLPRLFKEVVGFEGEELRTGSRGIWVACLYERPPFVCDLRRGESKQVSRVEIVGLRGSLSDSHAKHCKISIYIHVAHTHRRGCPLLPALGLRLSLKLRRKSVKIVVSRLVKEGQVSDS